MNRVFVRQLEERKKVGVQTSAMRGVFSSEKSFHHLDSFGIKQDNRIKLV